jgi:hypothetical protein
VVGPERARGSTLAKDIKGVNSADKML